MSSDGDRRSPPVLTAFLSHSYQAAGVNLYFHGLTSTVATVAFRVDSGRLSGPSATGPPRRRHTSTTRLERMIRDAEAFVAV